MLLSASGEKLPGARPAGRRAAIAAVVALLLTSIPSPHAAASGPSFGCEMARAPVESMICADPELSRLDSTVAEAYGRVRTARDEAGRNALLAEQRGWLHGRRERCGIPASGPPPTREQQWAWAPCLYEAALDRAIELGVADVAEPHPSCLERIAGVVPDGEAARERLPLRACNRGTRHLPSEVRADGLRAAAGRYKGWPSYFGSAPVGALGDGREVRQVYHWTGGTGRFTHLITLRREIDPAAREIWLTARHLGPGGDRCNGGIVEATVTGPETIALTTHATPFGLVAAGYGAAGAAGGDPWDEPVMRALPDCAVCCVGTVASEFDVASGRMTPVAARVDLTNADVTGVLEMDPVGSCLLGLLRAGNDGEIALDGEELQALASALLSACRAR